MFKCLKDSGKSDLWFKKLKKLVFRDNLRARLGRPNKYLKTLKIISKRNSVIL